MVDAHGPSLFLPRNEAPACLVRLHRTKVDPNRIGVLPHGVALVDIRGNPLRVVQGQMLGLIRDGEWYVGCAVDVVSAASSLSMHWLADPHESDEYRNAGSGNTALEIVSDGKMDTISRELRFTA